jgi:Ca2+-binding EF-hand superfamily protein
METVVNKTTLREVNFLVFQMLDRDNDGFVSVSDLFRFLGENGGAGILIEKDVFTCSGLIQQKRQKVSLSLTLQSDNKEVKTDEILICNHSIRLDTYR